MGTEGSGGNSNANSAAGKIVGGLLKKAVSLGAGAYITAEDTVTKTLSTVQIPKDLLREAIESFFESYSVTIHAEVKLSPKKKRSENSTDKSTDKRTEERHDTK